MFRFLKWGLQKIGDNIRKKMQMNKQQNQIIFELLSSDIIVLSFDHHD